MVQKHKNTTTCNCLNGGNRKGIDYRDGSCQQRGRNEAACNQEWLPGWRWRNDVEALSTVHPAVQPQRQQHVATQLHRPIGTATPFETDYRRGLLIHSRSPPDEIRFYWLCEKSPSHSCIKSVEQCTLNIWHGKSESITSEQMPLLLRRKSALCGNDLCHVPLIMVMIALEGVSWDVIQRAAECEWQGHPKWP